MARVLVEWTLLVALVLFSRTAAAQNTEELIGYCRIADTYGDQGGAGSLKPNQLVKAGLCIGFVQGTVQAWLLAKAHHPGEERFAVARETMTAQQVKILLKYVSKHPGSTALPMAEVIIRALEASYPRR